MIETLPFALHSRMIVCFVIADVSYNVLVDDGATKATNLEAVKTVHGYLNQKSGVTRFETHLSSGRVTPSSKEVEAKIPQGDGVRLVAEEDSGRISIARSLVTQVDAHKQLLPS